MEGSGTSTDAVAVASDVTVLQMRTLRAACDRLDHDSRQTNFPSPDEKIYVPTSLLGDGRW